MNKDYIKGALLIVAAAFCFSFQPIFGYLAYDDGANVYGLLLLRFMFATIFLQLFIRLRKRINQPQAHSHIRPPLMMGAVLALTSISYFSALQYISIGLTTLLFYLFPIYIYLLSILSRKERFSFVKIVAIMLAILGVYISVDSIGTLPLPGLFFGLAAGVGYGSYIALSGKYLTKLSTLDSLTWVSSGSFILLCVPFVLGEAVLPQTAIGYFAALGLCFISTWLSLGLLLKGSKLIVRTTDISILVMTEIGATLLLVWLLLDAEIRITEMIGAALVFCAAIIIFLYSSRQSSLKQQ
jgi:drug/metabolite transporter (DMT)-like permease